MSQPGLQAIPDGERVDLVPLSDLDGGAVRVTQGPDGVLSLAGSRCLECVSVVYPTSTICLECGSTRLEDVAMPRGGKLYSFSTVHVSTARATPYTLGYVDLPNGVRILSPVHAGPDLRCDMPVSLLVHDEGSFVCEPLSASEGYEHD